jgi:hypothetical protein
MSSEHSIWPNAKTWTSWLDRRSEHDSAERRSRIKKMILNASWPGPRARMRSGVRRHEAALREFPPHPGERLATDGEAGL